MRAKTVTRPVSWHIGRRPIAAIRALTRICAMAGLRSVAPLPRVGGAQVLKEVDRVVRGDELERRTDALDHVAGLDDDHAVYASSLVGAGAHGLIHPPLQGQKEGEVGGRAVLDPHNWGY
jgi:hypothetical protein